MESGIYKITNAINGNIYIGQSVNIRRRWYLHRNNATKTKKSYTVLERAFKKYGIDKFRFEVVERCENKLLNEREIFYINLLSPAYNMNQGGRGNKGFEVPNSVRKTLSKKGKKQWDSYSEDQKQRVIKNQLTGPKKGSHRDEQTKKLLSEKTRKHFENIGGMPKEQREAISRSLKGKSRPNLKHRKAVCAYNAKNELVAIYDSVKSAGESCKIHPSSISRALKTERNRAGGFSWKYRSQETISQESTLEKATSGSAAHPVTPDDDIVRSLLMIKVRVNDKGLIDLCYRSGEMTSVYAHTVYENDEFNYEYGLDQKLIHKPASSNRGEAVFYYAVWKLKNGGYGFLVMSKDDVIKHARKYSQAFKSSYSPWSSEFDEMAKKTVLKAVLKYAPIKTEFVVEATQKDDAVIITEDGEDLHSEYEVVNESDEQTDEAEEIKQKQAAFLEGFTEDEAVNE